MGMCNMLFDSNFVLNLNMKQLFLQLLVPEENEIELKTIYSEGEMKFSIWFGAKNKQMDVGKFEESEVNVVLISLKRKIWYYEHW